MDKKEELKNLLKWVKFSFYVTENREIFIYLKNKKYLILISQPIFQRRINVEITLIRRWKWNKIWRRIFNVAQRWYNVSARRWNNVKTTLHNVGTTLIQRCFNLASTLVKPILNPIGLVMIVDCVIVIHVKYMNSFYSAIWESIFLLYINNWTTNEISKNFLTVVHIVIHNVEAVVQRCSIKKVFLEIS